MIKTILIVSGSITLALGLYLNFKSVHLRDIVMGRGKLGLSVGIGYEEKEYDLKIKNSRTSEKYYYWGMGLTLIGIILNAYGALF